MIGLITDFRKTALIAGIAIAASDLWGFFLQVLIGPPGPTSDFAGSIAHFFVILLLQLPLPVLLVLLYRTGIRPALSRNLRFVAAALVVIRTAQVLLGIRDMWRAGILPDVSHVASPAGTQWWFILSPASHWWTAMLVITNVVSFGSGLAFVFFLVALARQRGPLQNADKRASRQVRNAALAAIIARVFLIFVLLISFQVYAHAVRTYGPPGMAAPSVLAELGRRLFALPGLIAPLIVLVGVRLVANVERS